MSLCRVTLVGCVFCACALFLVDGVQGETTGTFDADAQFVDGRMETVTDVWEYYQRKPVRKLCYIDGPERPHIPYGEIESIAFDEWNDDKRMTKITITLWDDTLREGLLWDNDSFFATRDDGTQWRGWIEGLKRITFRPVGTETEQGGND
jgi:hypothetical protein